jgi:hypothetical protein
MPFSLPSYYRGLFNEDLNSSLDMAWSEWMISGLRIPKVWKDASVYYF